MRRLDNFFKNKNDQQKSKIRNERQFINKQFIDQLESDRKKWLLKNKKKYEPLPKSFYSSKNAEIAPTLSELKFFLGECERSENFSAYWWWRVRGGDEKESISKYYEPPFEG